MKGLTAAERRLLRIAADPLEGHHDAATDDELEVIDGPGGLVSRGLVRWVDHPSDDDLEVTLITERGLLALRCCTVAGPSVLA